MIIKVKQTVQTEKEINIEFPYITLDRDQNRFFYNYDIDKCITVSQDTNSILHTRYSNEGLEYEQISEFRFFAAFDNNLKVLLSKLNK